MLYLNRFSTFAAAGMLTLALVGFPANTSSASGTKAESSKPRTENPYPDGSGYKGSDNKAAKSNVALDGYCPVCLVKMDKLVKGDPQFTSQYDGKTYMFPGEKQKKMFDENPAAFVPAHGGDCVVCQVEMSKQVDGDPQFHAVHDGRLFLFPGEKQLNMFKNNPEKYADADVALGGNCPVCLVEMGKEVEGSPEFASIYDGKLYMFPGEKQKKMFDENPVAYAPAHGGNCVVCQVEMGKQVAGSAEHFAVHDGRLYLFPGEKQLNMFKENPEKYADADVAMNGNCPVCKIEMGKTVEGKEAFSVDYNGKRYLFPGKKQMNMFLNNPEKYAVQ